MEPAAEAKFAKQILVQQENTLTDNMSLDNSPAGLKDDKNDTEDDESFRTSDAAVCATAKTK